MFLPHELLALIYLLTATNAYPQNGPQFNASSSIPDSTPAFALTESATQSATESATESIISINNVCKLFRCLPFLPTATGWSDGPEPTNLLPATQPDRVVTVQRPTIVRVHTSTAPTITPTLPPPNNNDNNGPGDADKKPSSNPLQSAPNPTPNSLLNNIISQLGDSQLQSQSQPDPTQPEPTQPLPTAASSHPLHVQLHMTPAPPAYPDAPQHQQSQAIATLGGTITLLSTTLSLTPGLSTTVGSGRDVMSIGITTDTAGQTIITLSSSGTAVTATISNAPAVITLPKTGFEASVTDAALQGSLTWSYADGAAASTSRKKGNAGMNVEVGWWIYWVVGGMVGLGVVV